MNTSVKQLEPIYRSKPKRWSQPFGGDEMSSADISRILQVKPFSMMDETRFSANRPLKGLIANDMRLRIFQENEIICHKGDYGHSVFLVLSGEIGMLLNHTEAVDSQKIHSGKNVWDKFQQLWKNHPVPEVRETGERHSANELPTMVLQPSELPSQQPVLFGSGAMVGEIAALTRTPRTATLYARKTTEVLEIRWQGLRDIMQCDENLKHEIEKNYRERSLRTHLREAKLFRNLPDEAIEAIVKSTQFESFGTFAWYMEYKSNLKKTLDQRLASEPIVINEGEYINGLMMVISGFCRLSVTENHGHRTTGYLGKSEVYGLEELAHQYLTGQPISARKTLRALGYLDVLWIPSVLVNQYVLPELQKKGKIKPIVTEEDRKNKTLTRWKPRVESKQGIDQDLLEFIVDNRFINGTATMVIDNERCVRCDECVKACEVAHDGNSRFVRQGTHHGRFMIANACMHCVDPVCMIGCPTGAISRHEHGGQVVINTTTCIGCGTCSNNCPYNNITMVNIRDQEGHLVLDESTKQPIEQATKCDLCVDQNNGPACERACAHDALIRVDLRKVKHLEHWIKNK
jgi:Fe-S-cluster-containing dehydrogenase component/CRP-like cAMP-binding protein